MLKSTLLLLTAAALIPQALVAQDSPWALHIGLTGQERTAATIGAAYQWRSDHGTTRLLGPAVTSKTDWLPDEQGKLRPQARYEFTLDYREVTPTASLGWLTHIYAGGSRLELDSAKDRPIAILGSEFGVGQLVGGDLVALLVGLRINGTSTEAPSRIGGTEVQGVAVYAGIETLFL